jgi:predicted RNA-binding protein YlxR (DUF448 family)
MNPVRTCVGCRQHGNRADLLRLVSIQGLLSVDSAKNLPGRGVWLHSNLNCLQTAIDRSAFSRGLKTKVQLPAQISDLAKFIEQAE